jgi:uncharacterized protein (DUF4415 family)
LPANLLELPLHRLAHGRSGDKGDCVNISVIAHRPEFFPILVEQVTVDRVAALFRHRQPTAVRRYALPRLGALNFVLENALDGGVNESLNLDGHGKTLAFLLLDLAVFIPADMAVQLGVAGSRHWDNPDQAQPDHKQRVYAAYDAYVVEYFKRGGRGYQARMNAVLKAYVDAQLAKEHKEK